MNTVGGQAWSGIGSKGDTNILNGAVVEEIFRAACAFLSSSGHNDAVFLNVFENICGENSKKFGSAEAFRSLFEEGRKLVVVSAFDLPSLFCRRYNSEHNGFYN